nr:MAG TPA: hypothetical protein [Caudoviricetes sp.]
MNNPYDEIWERVQQFLETEEGKQILSKIIDESLKKNNIVNISDVKIGDSAKFIMGSD